MNDPSDPNLPDDASLEALLRKLQPIEPSPEARRAVALRIRRDRMQAPIAMIVAMAAAAAACVVLAVLLDRGPFPSAQPIALRGQPLLLPSWAVYGDALRQSPAQLEGALKTVTRAQWSNDDSAQDPILSPRDAARFLEEGDPL